NVYSWKYSGINFRKEPINYAMKGKIATLLSRATYYQTGEKIPTNVRNKQYTALKVKPFRRSNSKLAYFLSGINKWVLEQDIQ
ncbi:peptidase C47, partial [Enterococcus faecalis]